VYVRTSVLCMSVGMYIRMYVSFMYVCIHVFTLVFLNKYNPPAFVCVCVCARARARARVRA